MTPIFIVLSLRQIEEIAQAIRAHRGPQAPASSCVIMNGYALPPRDGDNAGLVTHIRYKVAGAIESHNLH